MDVLLFLRFLPASRNIWKKKKMSVTHEVKRLAMVSRIYSLSKCLASVYHVPSRQIFFFLKNRLDSLYSSRIKLCGGHIEPVSSARSVGLYKMVSELLTGRLGEHGLLPEVGGETAAALRDGIKGGLGKVAQGGRPAPA